MIVEYVNYDNLNLLEDAFTAGILNEKDITKDFGNNLPLLLSHIKLTFVINEISIFEAYMLKKFCSGNLVDLGTSMDDNKINPDKYPITHRTVRSLQLLNMNIMNDNDVSVKPGVLLFPAKCVEKRCLVTFQGFDVLSVIGSITKSYDSFFMRMIENMKSSPETSKSEIISNLLIERFFREFYSFIGFKVQHIDLLTDSTLDFAYLQHAKEDNTLVSLSHVNSIYGDISFINNTYEDYSLSLSQIGQNQNLLQIPDRQVNMDTTEVFFVCNTTFHSFMEAFIYLPIGSILESTDIKILYSSKDFIIPTDMEKYRNRLTSIIEKLMSERESVRVKKEVKLTNNGSDSEEVEVANRDLDNYNLIQLNTRIQYSIRFRLSDISHILMEWEDKIKNQNIYGDTDNYLSKELLKMIDSMKNYAIAVYKTFVK